MFTEIKKLVLQTMLLHAGLFIPKSCEPFKWARTAFQSPAIFFTHLEITRLMMLDFPSKLWTGSIRNSLAQPPPPCTPIYSWDAAKFPLCNWPGSRLRSRSNFENKRSAVLTASKIPMFFLVASRRQHQSVAPQKRLSIDLYRQLRRRIWLYIRNKIDPPTKIRKSTEPTYISYLTLGRLASIM